MTGMLVEQGVVALDDDHLRPEWTDERADITVENLLRMTSGLEWDETYDLGTPITRMLYLEPDMGAYVASLPARARARHRAGVLERQHHPALLGARRAHRPRRRPAPADAPRRARPLVGRLRAGCRGHPGLLVVPLGDPARLGRARPVRAAGRRVERRAAAARGLDGADASPSRRRRRRPTTPATAMGFRVNALPDGSLRWPELPEDTFYMSGHDGQKVHHRAVRGPRRGAHGLHARRPTTSLRACSSSPTRSPRWADRRELTVGSGGPRGPTTVRPCGGAGKRSGRTGGVNPSRIE